MRTAKDFAPTTPSETRDCGFDFSNDLADGETVASAAFTIAVAETDAGATVDASPSGRKVGSATIEDSTVTDLTSVVAVQRLSGMLDGNTYDVICRATTSSGQVLELSAHLPCRVAS